MAGERIDLWIVDAQGLEIDNQLLLNSLFNSLNTNQYVSAKAQVRMPEAPSDDMALDVVATIQLILSAGFEFAKLALAIAEWRAKKGGDASSIKIRSEGGTSVLHPDDMNDPSDKTFVVRRALTQAPDPERSACVLIGVSDYANLTPLPGVGRNIERLRTVLGATGVWGIPTDRIYEVDYPRSATDIMDKVKAAAAIASDTLLVYFAGHGFLRGTELFLALPEATADDERHAIQWRDIAAVVEQNGAGRKVIWLDCCSAGGAVPGASNLSGLLEPTKRGETYFLAAVARSGRAKSQHGSGCTAFTGELVATLNEGIASDPPEEFLSLNAVHQNVRNELKRKRLPEPIRHDPDGIGQVPFFHNRGKNRALRPRPWQSPRLPAGPWSRRARAVGAVAAAVIALAAVAWFAPGPEVSGLDLAKYCSTLAPGAAQEFQIADHSCVRPIDLNDACLYSYQIYGLEARFTSPDPNSAQCFNSPPSSTSRGGISDMTGYCSTRTNISDIRATARNPRYPNAWVCQSDANLDAVCDSQNNRTDLEYSEEADGGLSCYQRHWF